MCVVALQLNFIYKIGFWQPVGCNLQTLGINYMKILPHLYNIKVGQGI